MTEILEMFPGTVEYRLKQMEENMRTTDISYTMRSTDISSKLPECPVNIHSVSPKILALGYLTVLSFLVSKHSK